MLLTISTTHQPATDLGYLLMKNPDNVHVQELPFGRATLFFPQADVERCTAAIMLEVDPVALVRGNGHAAGREDQYVTIGPMPRLRCSRSRSGGCSVRRWADVRRIGRRWPTPICRWR